MEKIQWDKELNKEQFEAVSATEGPLLVLAGAGTGKTRVITYRIAYLIGEKNISPENILAVTFTNKAADEMKERIFGILKNCSARPRISTFHSLGLFILRSNIDRLKRDANFIIYDETDQLAAVKKIIGEIAESGRWQEAGKALNAIGRAKDSLKTPEDVRRECVGNDDEIFAYLYETYAERLLGANALDFDDLIMLPAMLLRQDADLREYYNRRFRYVLVDEFQDTNFAQYEFVKLLSEKTKNICVVGDEDQSIYGWRGAEPDNIFRFREDFPKARLIKLERNYRSTDVILNAAGAVIAKNKNRIGKNLRTTVKGGARIFYHSCLTDFAESAVAGDAVLNLRLEDPAMKIAVLYRTNAQSRPIEEALIRRSVPYHIVRGARFYERSEVKDVIAYLKFLASSGDSVSLKRILNVPPRGIGAKTIARLEATAKERRITLWESILHILETKEASPREENALKEFFDLTENRLRPASRLPASEAISAIVEATDYFAYLGKAYAGEETSGEREENVKELASAAAQNADDAGDSSLRAFLDRVSLVMDSDAVSGEQAVQLMTLHSAKGLEFDAVLIAGLNDGLLPHSRSTGSEKEYEEERRLFYVGITRAKKRLILTSAEERRSFGTKSFYEPSPFLEDIPRECFEFFETENAEPLFEDDMQFISDDEPDYRPGMRLRHPHYGVGRILRVEPSLNGKKLTMEFSVGLKMISTAHTQLERV